LLFFFSSRRRHTRFSRDWSSDVCSSDLINAALKASGAPQEVLVLSVAFNERGNGILTLREGCLAHQLLVFRDTVRKAFKTLNSEVLSVEADQQWSKYKLHGVSTEQFGGEKGMEELKAEIETYNPVSSWQWLSVGSRDQKQEKERSSPQW